MGGHRFAWCCATTLALGCTLTTPSQRAPPPEAAVRMVEHDRFQAMVARDLRALDTLLADELTYTHTTGRVDTKASLLEDLRVGRLVYDSISPIDVQVRRYGNTAVATGTARMQVRAAGEVRRFTIRFTETYAAKGGRWRLVAWQSTRLPESD